MVAAGHGNRSRIGGRSADFEDCEDLLYRQFYSRRVYQGLPVSYRWLRRHFARLLRAEKPPGWGRAKISVGWAIRFCRRYRISDQVKTNHKMLPLCERIPRIQKFHTWLIYGLQSSGPQRCPKYGRFPAKQMFYADQIPLPFVYGRARSLNPVGMDCWLAQPGDGLNKRQATLHLTIRAEGEQVAMPGVVFRGAGTRISDWEKSHYPPGVRVYWQANAWVDAIAMDQITDDFLLDTSSLEGSIMLGLDNLSAHHDERVKNKLSDADVYPVFTPSQCTDVVAPGDHHVGQWMKDAMRVMYEAEMDNNIENWEEGGLSAAERRIYIVTWVAEAWKVMQTMPEFIRTAFVQTGWLLAKDGSENHLVKLRKWKETYNFPRPDPREDSV
jgi:hypothetical protein